MYKLIVHEYYKDKTASEAACIIYQKKQKIVEDVCSRWYKKFDLNEFNTENQICSRRPKIVDNDQINEYITMPPIITSYKIFVQFACDQKIIINYLHDLNYINKRCQVFKQK